MSSFYLRIATPDADRFSGRVEYVSLDTPDGRIGLMRGALARIAVLDAGRIEITDGGTKKIFVCGDGLVRVDAGGVTVLTSKCGPQDENEDAADKGSVSDLKLAKVAIASSLKKMKEKKSGGDLS